VKYRRDIPKIHARGGLCWVVECFSRHILLHLTPGLARCRTARRQYHGLWAARWKCFSRRDDKSTPTKHLTPPPHHSSRPAAAHTDTETPLPSKGGRRTAPTDLAQIHVLLRLTGLRVNPNPSTTDCGLLGGSASCREQKTTLPVVL